MAPVNDAGLDEMNDAFLTCFSTQKAASFPAPDYDGPFSHWSEVSQRAQRQQLGVVLGEEFFAGHADRKVRESTGYVFLKEMSREAFGKTAAQLRGRIESGSKRVREEKRRGGEERGGDKAGDGSSNMEEGWENV